MKTLYFNTYDIDGRFGGSGKDYKGYCEKYAAKNEMEFETYEAMNEKTDLSDNEFVDGENGLSSGLNLWESFCAGVSV